MGKTKTLLKTLILSLFSIVLIYSSCEIGLGSAVDTEVPTVEITNPPVDSIVRGSLGISGSWSDDGEISSISCMLTQTENSDVSYTFTADNFFV